MSRLQDVWREAVERNDATEQSSTLEGHREFALNRFTEGVKIREHLEARYPRELPRGARVLDIGCGNAGISLPFAEDGRYRCVAMETSPRPEVARILRGSEATMLHVAARGDFLPIVGSSIDLVLYVETIEHVDEPGRLGREIERVLRPGGICYITTPARLRHLLARDPHYSIPGLLLLPDSLQARAVRTLRPGIRYEVNHIFWSVPGILGTLPGQAVREITSRHPWVRGPLRKLDWDWIITQKPRA